jgi:hypothetical protein
MTAFTPCRQQFPTLLGQSLHRCLKRHGISRLPEIADEKAAKKPFKTHPMDYFHIDIAEVRTEEGTLYLPSADAITAALAPPGRTPTVLGNSGWGLVGARYAVAAARHPANWATQGRLAVFSHFVPAEPIRFLTIAFQRGGRSRLVSPRLVHPVLDLAAAKPEPRTPATAHHRIGPTGDSAPV